MRGNEAQIRKRIYGESQGDSNPRELGSHHLESRSRHICAFTCLSSFQSNSSLCSLLLLSLPADSSVIARPSLSTAFHGKAIPSSPGWTRALSPGDPESAGGREIFYHRQPLPRRSVHASSPHASLQPSTDPWALGQELCVGSWCPHPWPGDTSQATGREEASAPWGGENYLFHQPYSHQGAACPGGSPAQRPRRRGWEHLQCWGWQAWRPSGWCSDPACICLSAPRTCAVPHLSPSRLGRPGSRSSGLWLRGQRRCRWHQAGEAWSAPSHLALLLPCHLPSCVNSLERHKRQAVATLVEQREKTEAPRAQAICPWEPLVRGKGQQIKQKAQQSIKINIPDPTFPPRWTPPLFFSRRSWFINTDFSYRSQNTLYTIFLSILTTVLWSRPCVNIPFYRLENWGPRETKWVTQSFSYGRAKTCTRNSWLSWLQS